MRVNSNLTELRQQQIAARPDGVRQADVQPAAATQPAQTAPHPQSPAAVADLSARIATENRSASRSQPIDAQAAEVLRHQIQDQAQAAMTAHKLDAQRVSALLD